MSREVRRVPASWQHPRDDRGEYRPLLADYRAAQEYRNPHHECYDSEGVDPDPADYMPVWPESEKTHLQMYETVTEGTPLSPVMDTPEKLARWLADNNASASGHMTATYEDWLAMVRRGWAPSGVLTPSGFISGVEACNAKK